jgi:kynurenine formamidase
MRARRVAVSAAAAAAFALSGAMARSSARAQEGQPSPLNPVAPQVAPRTPKNSAEFDQLFHQLKNWGRWGKDDQLGAANLVTDAKRKQAAALVKSGIAVSLSHDYLTEKAPDNPNPFEHVMNPGFSTDTYRVRYHGASHSHLDALCHYQYQDKTYNGYAKADVNTEKGCMQLGIENLKGGIVTRGILLDIPRLKGVTYLEPGTPVFVEDIEAWEKQAGVKVSPGDAIFLYTGRWARREKIGPWEVQTIAAGYHASVATWIKARGVSFVGSDSVTDVRPNLVEGIRDPFHTLMIPALGIAVFDNQDLEALARTAAQLRRWEFMLTTAPLAVVHGTGSPGNVIALF